MKTAIIGGGICGLYLAWKLSEKGEEITVFERKNQIGNDVCSGLFSRRILDFIPLSAGLIENKINSVFLHFPGKTIAVDFSKEFYLMSHYGLDNLIAELAQKAGAEIILNKNISSLPEGFDRIIGCDGANSFVRRSLKLPDPQYRLGILGLTNSTETELTETRSLLINRDRVSVDTWPCKNGFIWKIPKSNGIEYGIIAPPQNAKTIFNDFLKKNKIKIENIKAKLIPQGLIIPKNPLITLCGDASGLTKPWSGGGVIWGLKAADILLKNFPDFLGYRDEARKFFFPKIIFAKSAINIIDFLGFNLPFLLPKKNEIESDFLF